MSKLCQVCLFLVLIHFSFSAHADAVANADAHVKTVLLEVEQLFKTRSCSNPQLIAEILQKLAAIENTAEDSDLNYSTLIWQSKVLHWRAKYLEKLDFHNKNAESTLILGKAKADAAIELDKDYAEGYYYSALHQADQLIYYGHRVDHDFWEKRDGLEKRMEEARCRPTLEGEYGSSIDGFGPYRIPGILELSIFDTLWWPLCNLSPAKIGLKEAYERERNYAENVVEYARCLSRFSYGFYGPRYNKLIAGFILDRMLACDPKTFNPDRVEETLFEFERAKQERTYIQDHLFYNTAKEGLQDYATMTKCEEEASNRVTASQTKLNDLNGEHLNWVNVIQQQKKIFSTLELLRTKIENAAPELILKIQAYLASQQDNLAAVLDKLNCQLKEAKSDDVREALQFDILVLSDLLIAKKNLGGRPEDLKKAIEQAVNGTAEERAKALSYFDPLTQVVLKWVFQTTGFSKDTVFLKFKEAVAELGSFSEQHLSELESAIQLESQALKYAKDDYELAQYIVSKVYQACQDARGL